MSSFSGKGQGWNLTSYYGVGVVWIIPTAGLQLVVSQAGKGVGDLFMRNG